MTTSSKGLSSRSRPKKNNFVKDKPPAGPSGVFIPEPIQEIVNESDSDDSFGIEDVTEIFEDLENDNLFLIQQIQE